MIDWQVLSPASAPRSSLLALAGHFARRDQEGFVVAKYRVTHPSNTGSVFIVSPSEQRLPMGKGYMLDVRGVGVPQEDAIDVVEQFRLKYGKIQSNHSYKVERVFADPEPVVEEVAEEEVEEESLDELLPEIQNDLSILELPSEIVAKLVGAGLTTVEQVMSVVELTEIRNMEAAEVDVIYRAIERVTEPEHEPS